MSHSKHGYVRGHFEREGTQLYVGRGVGVSFVPLRVGAKPEIPVVTLRVGSDGATS